VRYTRGETLSEFTDSEEEILEAIFECLERLELAKKGSARYCFFVEVEIADAAIRNAR
jgi:hypothetical protein